MSPIVLAIMPVLFFLAAAAGCVRQEAAVDSPAAGRAPADASEPAANPAAKKTFAAVLLSRLKRNNRPDWVNALPRKIGDAYQISVEVTPFATQLERDTADVPKALQNALNQYVRLQLGAEAAGQVQLPPEELSQCIKDEWAMTVYHSGHPMTHLYLLLEFDSRMKDRVAQEWKQVREEKRQALIARRLWRTGMGVAAGLLLLATLFLTLRIDQVTAGARRGRLGFLAVVVGLAVVAGTYFSLRLVDSPVHASDAAPLPAAAGESLVAVKPAASEDRAPATNQIALRRWMDIVPVAVAALFGLGGIVGLILLLGKKKAATPEQ